MGIIAIRDALETMLRGVDGIAAASGLPTEKIGAMPFAWVGFDDDEITMAGVEVDLHTLPITVVVGRKVMLPIEIKAVEMLIEGIKVAIRTNQSLGLPNVDRVQYTAVREGIYGFAGMEGSYTGFTMTIQVKERNHVTIA